jgi:AhpD family alkylhydroperoxidase
MRITLEKKHKYPWPVRLIFLAQKIKYGQTLVPNKFWGLSPRLLYGIQCLYFNLTRKSSPISSELRLLLNTKVSQINQCHFCIDISQHLLKKSSVSQDKLEAIINYQTSNLFNDEEKCALKYAEAMTSTNQQVTDEIFSRLKTYYDNKTIVELTGVIAYQNMTSKFNAALDIPTQGFCLNIKQEK